MIKEGFTRLLDALTQICSKLQLSLIFTEKLNKLGINISKLNLLGFKISKFTLKFFKLVQF